ncbi:oligopeptide/dipeptide ABC transporter ATPase [Thermotoga sp. Cell2]|uniref:ABC transporter ATP-binding protein n=1 Tax=unclassified Thermotoga TaxID=2631113 RepID=UPI000540BF35|nr:MULTISPECIES: ABC transporter ATP-binding protein [unclassified Thermotoga]AIY88185.1 oligopeptide/dipeptide ABC transporter ATPase [Thermotoga sp. Cell2]KHC96859.1 oligopeptide/dipeptide ABC transporter ATPase [Thermotoga sp. Xyl54]
MPLLEIKNLTKIFTIGSIFSRTRIVAVDNVNFDINEAEIFTLAGESGCGKTTTAKIILGFEEPTSGEIVYKGRKIDRVHQKEKERRELLKEIQAVFQNPFSTFNPLRKVDRYFYETLFNLGIADTKKKAEEIIKEKLSAVGISFEEFSEKYPSEFSGGQLQRISIARALLTNPSLLVADEPVSMVDASLRMSIVNLFKDLKEQYGVSVLYITHDLTTAYYVSDRIAVMFRGNIVELGPAEKVLMEPKHPYTQLLRESVPEPDPKKKWDIRIKLSETEQAEYLRQGCKFAGRCPKVMDICRKEPPPYFEVDGVQVKCWLYR